MRLYAIDILYMGNQTRYNIGVVFVCLIAGEEEICKANQTK